MIADRSPHHAVGPDPTPVAVALAALGLSPARLRRVMAGRSPSDAWGALATGTHEEDPDGRLAPAVRRADPETLARRCRSAGIAVHLLGSPGYPGCLAGDEEAPAVLFARGDTAALDRSPRVAVVGTRSASVAGLATARAIGASLAGAGVVVVSGLATGIDSAALQGALEPMHGAAPVAVLGTAHDGRVLPAQRALAAGIADRGAVVAEHPPGTAAARWHFAVRNRIMAAVAQVVVVVEAHAEGGVLHTVRAARRRGVPVAAVPGSVQSASAAGTNALLVEGAACVRHGGDVLQLLSQVPGVGPLPMPHAVPAAGRRRPVTGGQLRLTDPEAARVLAALGPDPVDLATVVARSGLPLGSVALGLERLAELSLAEAETGWWRRTTAARRR